MTFERHYPLTFLLPALLFLLPGCVSNNQAPASQKLSTSPGNICKLAVLPFINDTKYLQGNVIFYRIFVSELHKIKGLSISQEGDVRKIYRQMRISPGQNPNLEDLKILGDRLNVQAFITGRIVKMREKKGSMDADPVLGVDLKMINAANGKSMMTIYNSRTGEDYRKIMHFGLVNTITGLASLVSGEIARQWFPGGSAECY